MLQRFIARPARIDMEDERARLFLPAVPDNPYIFAQLNDYQAGKAFTNQPPFSAILNATVSPSAPLGSFGFGLWNETVAENGETRLATDGFAFLYARSAQSETPVWQAAAWQADGRLEQTELPDIASAKPRRYTLDWQPEAVSFEVDGKECLRINQPPGLPLGFAIWMSNRTLRFGPDGKLADGLCATSEAQWLEVTALRFKRSG